ncbi:MAG: CheR family methyltransferase, partial [Pseudothermotoga sp.]
YQKRRKIMSNVSFGISPLATMSDKDFSRLSEFVHTTCGIKMPPTKKTMLEGRLQKRLRNLGMKSFSEYSEYLFSPEGLQDELIHMIDVVTTNKTDFFREPGCFDYLIKKAVPELVNLHGAGIQKKLIVWSAGCSSGEEPYTLAMILSEFAESYPGFHFSILATDISARMLEFAARAIYPQERIEPVPVELKIKYFMTSRDKNDKRVRIVPELRALVKFRRLNFMDKDFGIKEPMDIIFCRNVIIYFDKTTQERLINRLCQHLIPGGYLVLGHSEILTGMDVPLVRVAQTVYRKSVQ